MRLATRFISIHMEMKDSRELEKWPILQTIPTFTGPKEIEKKKSERPKPRRFVSEVKSERKWTWQKKLEEHGYEKLGAHD